MKDIFEQEKKCLEAKRAIKSLRTLLFELEDFHDYKYWNVTLRHLDKQIDDFYWQL